MKHLKLDGAENQSLIYDKEHLFLQSLNLLTNPQP